MFKTVFSILFLLVGQQLSACESTYNNMIPMLKLDMTPQGCFETCAYAGYGEIGKNNFRGGATIGAYISPSQRFKVSGDFLTQNLKYNFLKGQRQAWTNQFTIGTVYQIIMPNCRFMSLDLGIACSHASDTDLKTVRLWRCRKLQRRISGSNNGFGFLGATSEVWEGGIVSAAFTYDYLRFHHRYCNENKTRNIGVGGSIAFSQQFLTNFELDAEAQFRAPYNYYNAALLWNPGWFDSLGMTVGCFGSYTRGKKGVAKVATAGLSLSFAFGNECCSSAWFNDLYSNEEEYCSPYGDIAAWTAKPAAYVPVVLSSRDQGIKKNKWRRRHHCCR